MMSRYISVLALLALASLQARHFVVAEEEPATEIPDLSRLRIKVDGIK